MPTRIPLCLALCLLALAGAPRAHAATSAAPVRPLQQTTLLATHDANNQPQLYYGRVFVRSEKQMASLDLFAFLHAPQPFFDEYDPHGQPQILSDGSFAGRYEYAIATGVQWNILIQYPGLVDGVEINPKATSAAHPLMDSVVRSDASLDPVWLAKQGFTLPPPPRTMQPICTGQSTASQLR
jgi:hypothetical protein